MGGINSIGSVLRNVVTSTNTQSSKAARALSGSSEKWDNSLEKLKGKFLERANSSPADPRREGMARQPMGTYANRMSGGSFLFQRGIFTALSGMYEKSTGKLINYDKIKVNDVAASLSWALENELMPSEASSIIDIGAAHGGAALLLGKKYQDAKILALDPDPQSAKFIEEKIKNSDSTLNNPERLDTFSGTFTEALTKGKFKENSVDLICMQAVAPYMSDEDLTETLQGVHTALAPGGKVILSCYGEEHFSKANAKSNLTLRSDIQMLGMFENAGLSVECIGNTLQTGEGKSYKKNNREMSDVLEQKSMPEHSDGKYWHSVYITATKA